MKTKDGVIDTLNTMNNISQIVKVISTLALTVIDFSTSLIANVQWKSARASDFF